MAEYPISPKHNVFKKYRTVNYINSYVFAPPVDLSTNTEIGGVASSISTPALLATKLAIDVSRITNFSIVGSDIKCKITGSYSVPDNAFSDNASISYYEDLDKCTGIGIFSFNNCTNLNRVIFPKVTSIGLTATTEINTFRLCTSLDYVYLPLCVNYGATTTGGGTLGGLVFNGAKPGLKVYANQTMATINSGGVEGDLAYVISTLLGTISYVLNYTSPLSISNLAINQIYNTALTVTFTPPSSTNTIDYYEVYLNGVYSSKMETIGLINSLSVSTNYNVNLVAVDIYYNKSALSNTINSTTSYNSNKIEAENFISATSNVDSAQITAINNLTLALKNNGIFFKLKSLNIKVGGTSAKHKYNLIDARDLDAAYRYIYSGTWVHSALGAKANGTNAYANTFFNLSTLGLSGNFSMGYYITVANTLFGDRHGMGAYSGGNNWVGLQHNSSTQLMGMAYSGSPPVLTITSPNDGFFAISVNKALKRIYHKNLSLSQIRNGTNVPTINLYEGALNLSNSYYSGLDATYGTSFLGEALTDTEMGLLKSEIITFETALSR